MHLAVNIFIIFSVWKWADYKNWRKYHATMLFLPLMSLVYGYLSFSSGIFLWKAVPDFLINNTMTELVYTSILMPCTVLLFLSNYPDSPIKIMLYFIKYIFIYGAIETIMYLTGRMDYDGSWSIWHSLFFYFLMFPSIIIHYKRPILAYIIFILITAFSVFYFKLPIK